MAKRYYLVKTVDEQAIKLLEAGKGEISDYEVIAALIEKAAEYGETIEFVRQEKDREVVIDVGSMTMALEEKWEVRAT